MGKVIVITSGKGGVGKTTSTANIGTALALLGHKVALLDTDIGLRNLDVIMGLENRIVYDLVDAVRGNCRLKQALIKDKRLDNLFLLPAAQTKDKTAVSNDQMAELCEKLKEEFDYVVIDCPAGIEHGFKNAIAGADDAVVVATPEVSAVRDADRIIGLLEAAGLESPRLIVNRMRNNMVQKRRHDERGRHFGHTGHRAAGRGAGRRRHRHLLQQRRAHRVRPQIPARSGLPQHSPPPHRRAGAPDESGREAELFH